MIRSDGYLKILDFGLAGLEDGDVSNNQIARSGLTSLAGTPRYMSPEQIHRAAVTVASDIYSFGLVFREMLRNPRIRRPPQALLRLIDAMLLDNPARRPSAAEVVKQLDRMPPGGTRLPQVAIAAGALIVIVALLALLARRPREFGADAQLVPRNLTSYPGDEAGVSFSPDGSQFAFAWNGLDRQNFDIYVRAVSGGEPKRLTTHAAVDSDPAWSPDGRTIAFSRLLPDGSGQILMMPASGGTERQVGVNSHVLWQSRLVS
jgi:serine/threonine protein kinase